MVGIVLLIVAVIVFREVFRKYGNEIKEAWKSPNPSLAQSEESNSKLSESMLRLLKDRYNVSDIAISWLKYSLELGRDVDTCCYYAIESAKAGLPYLCESELELEYVRQVYKTNRIALEMQLLGYRYLGEPDKNNMAHPYKLEYWRRRYLELARRDQEAYKMLKNKEAIDISSGFITEEMISEFNNWGG